MRQLQQPERLRPTTELHDELRAHRANAAAVQHVEKGMGTPMADRGSTPAGSTEPSYLEVARRLMGAARGLVGSDAAEDLVFDTMSVLLPRWDSISGNKIAYARRSMVNRFQDQLRHQRVELGHRHTLSTPDHERPRDDAVAARVDMAGALQLLPERTRQVVVLRYQCDLSADRVGAVLGIPAGSVRRIAHDGLRRLSTHLDHTTEGTSA